MTRALTVFLAVMVVGGFLFWLLHAFLGELRGEYVIVFWSFVCAIAAASTFMRGRE